ncbi:unnamed protein product [Staurois parvus]|uniref:Uncharacterized protein n=1 Tax=Staurois parvus TaxID=386267 RepID=A0ABN9GHA5_9NEOB|nr:unnamed protein product [Staurois parvus]
MMGPLFLPLTPMMGHYSSTDTNDGALFLPLTPTDTNDGSLFLPTDTNDGTLFLPLTPMMGHYSSH